MQTRVYFLFLTCYLVLGRVESWVRALGFSPFFSFPGPPGFTRAAPKSYELWPVLVCPTSRSPTLLGVRFRLVQSGSGLVREWFRAGFSFPVSSSLTLIKYGELGF